MILRGLNTEADVIGHFDRLEFNQKQSIQSSKGEKLLEIATFTHPNQHMPFTRAVTNLDWSPHSAELFLCGYGGGEGSWDPEFPNGIVNIFSTVTPDLPEITLKCQSEITSVSFHTYEPSIVLGGTDSGYIVKWDLRTKKAFPVMKSNISCKNLIKSICVVSQQSTISVSNDGKVWDWGEDIKEPNKTFDLLIPENSKESKNSDYGSSSLSENNEKKLNVHCVCFQQDETNQFYVGSESSALYLAKIH